ncbi:MAG TPA: hypothetical protein VEY33_03345 [Gemmatimonadota bacterium]|nr:hypothetical protein [Gemmatimonadota bacterium]
MTIVASLGDTMRPPHEMLRRILLPATLALLLPPLVSAQPASSGDDLDRDIAFYEDTLDKIRNKKWIYLPVPNAGVLISPEQEANMFSYLILTGQMHPDSVAPRHRRYREGTRVLEDGIVNTLTELRAQKFRREVPNPNGPPPEVVPDRAQGVLRGTWTVLCWMGSEPLNEGGSFTLRLEGTGSVTGTYTGPSGSLPATGTIDDAGNIQGHGSHPDGSFSFFARVQIVGTTPRLVSGNVHFVPSNPDVSCAGGDLTRAVS